MATYTHRRDRHDGAAAIQPALDERDDDAIDPPIAAGRPSLKSFVLQVSAGQPQGVADATQVVIDDGDEADADPNQVSMRRIRPAMRHVDKRPHESPAVDATRRTRQQGAAYRSSTAAPAVKASLAQATRVLPAIRARHTKSKRGAPPIVASLSLHCVMFAALVGMHLPGTEPLHELLWATAPVEDEELVLNDVAIAPAEVDAPVADADAPAELLDPGAAAYGELDATAALAATSGDPALAAGAMDGELGALFGDSGAGVTTFDSGLGDAPTAQFFGTKIEGRRIVFILDNSGSMQGGRLETVIDELLRCVDSLDKDQEFYVIFHSDMVYPLFYPDPVDRYIRPTDANKRQLARWLDTVELCLGDSVEEAIAIAQMIEPDTVFLLSDGRITGTGPSVCC